MNMVNLTARFIETNEDGRLIIEGSITSDFARKYLFITPAYTFFPSDSESRSKDDKNELPYITYRVESKQVADGLIKRMNENLGKDGHNITSHP